MIQCPSKTEATEMKRSSSAFEEYSNKRGDFLDTGMKTQKGIARALTCSTRCIARCSEGTQPPPQCPPADILCSKLQGYTSQMALWWKPPRSKINTHPGSSCAHPAHLTKSVLSQVFYMKPPHSICHRNCHSNAAFPAAWYTTQQAPGGDIITRLAAT